MRIAVTGATGFVGSHFAELALARGHEVIGLYHSSGADKQAEAERLRRLGANMQRADILDAGSLASAMRGAECVCHFAAAFRESGVDDSYFQRVNVEGTRNVLQAGATAGARRFVFCGTAGIHGQRVAQTIDERSPIQPWNAYEISKNAAEALVRELAAPLGMEYVILRPTAVYGPRDSRLLKLFRAAAKGRFPLFGRGEGRRHMVYVTDVAEAFLRACTVKDAASEAFIIAGPRATSLRDMLAVLAQVVGRKKTGPRLPLWPMLALAGTVETVCGKLGVKPPIYRRRMDFYRNDAAYDCSKALQRLDWKPQVDLPSGLAMTYAAYRADGHI